MSTRRRRLGAWCLDAAPALWHLRPAWLGGSPAGWLRLVNRRDDVTRAPDGNGLAVSGPWTSELTVARECPRIGRSSLRQALAQWPVDLSGGSFAAVEAPEISVIIGHRGRERLDLLTCTLASFSRQRGVRLECLVVDQSPEPVAHDALPGIRHVHAPPPRPDMPFARSWAFNVGVTHARADLLLFHDGDMLVPRDYARALVAEAGRGAEVVNLKRFVFYLGEAASRELIRTRRVPDVAAARVVQNLLAGGSLAITRQAFDEIGGFDEGFVGWGGEDNELWERAAQRALYSYGRLPLVHLWHEEQPERASGPEPAMVRRYHELSRRPPEERAAELRARPRGALAGPRPAWSPGG